MMISNPHFLYADSKYLEGVTGLSPNASIHESEGYVEPVSSLTVKLYAYSVNVRCACKISID
jgi:hypothetical protein